jgi:hypothetical protein
MVTEEAGPSARLREGRASNRESDTDFRERILFGSQEVYPMTAGN